jgi:hypothetical protein
VRPFGEKVAGQRQFHAARGSIEEAVAEELFQTLDLLAERRLRNPQDLRCLAEMQRLRHGEEVAKVAELNLFIHMPII